MFQKFKNFHGFVLLKVSFPQIKIFTQQKNFLRRRYFFHQHLRWFSQKQKIKYRIYRTVPKEKCEKCLREEGKEGQTVGVTGYQKRGRSSLPANLGETLRNFITYIKYHTINWC